MSRYEFFTTISLRMSSRKSFRSSDTFTVVVSSEAYSFKESADFSSESADVSTESAAIALSTTVSSDSPVLFSESCSPS